MTSEPRQSAIIVTKGGIEKTINDWVEYLKDEKNPFGRDYTKNNILSYAQKKQHGFSYKEYPDLPGEVWKKITGSENSCGRWEISNMSRVKHITSHAENVLYGERLSLNCDGYPRIKINGKNSFCHILAFMTFFPEEYAAKKPEEYILHEKDDKMDFRPHKLRIGSHADNRTDAHDNGKYDGTPKARMKCASYINGVLEKEHDSQLSAVRYLKSIGYESASFGNISVVLSGNGKQTTAYNRTWKKLV